MPNCTQPACMLVPDSVIVQIWKVSYISESWNCLKRQASDRLSAGQSLQSAWWCRRDHESLPFQAISRLWKVTNFSNLYSTTYVYCFNNVIQCHRSISAINFYSKQLYKFAGFRIFMDGWNVWRIVSLLLYSMYRQNYATKEIFCLTMLRWTIKVVYLYNFLMLGVSTWSKVIWKMY